MRGSKQVPLSRCVSCSRPTRSHRLGPALEDEDPDVICHECWRRRDTDEVRAALQEAGVYTAPMLQSLREEFRDRTEPATLGASRRAALWDQEGIDSDAADCFELRLTDPAALDGFAGVAFDVDVDEVRTDEASARVFWRGDLDAPSSYAAIVFDRALSDLTLYEVMLVGGSQAQLDVAVQEFSETVAATGSVAGGEIDPTTWRGTTSIES